MKNKKLLALNILLGVLVIAMAFGLYSRMEAASQRYAILTPDGPPKEVPDFAGPASKRRVRAGDHLPIVERTLFSTDRNPIIEVVPPPEPPVEPRPDLPRLVGIMELGQGPIALMSVDANAPAGPVEVGEKIGAFTFLGTEGDKVVLQWKDEKFSAEPWELKGASGDGGKRATLARSSRGASQRGPDKGLLARNQGSAKQATTAAAPQKTQVRQSSTSEPRIGTDMGNGRYRAFPGDKSPAGTRHQGFVKRSQQSPFGTKSWWEKDQKK